MTLKEWFVLNKTAKYQWVNQKGLGMGIGLVAEIEQLFSKTIIDAQVKLLNGQAYLKNGLVFKHLNS